jgi:hypothetical protein
MPVHPKPHLASEQQYTCAPLCIPAPTYQCIPVPTYQCIPVPTYQCIPAPTYQCIPVPTYQCIHVPTCHCIRCAHAPVTAWLRRVCKCEVKGLPKLD